jgi:HEAT repeat protein
MFQKHLIEGAVLHYGEFINDLSKVIICDFTHKLDNFIVGSVVFFKSQWSEIRSNAASLVGFLVGNMTAEQCTKISKQHVCSALSMLLKDPEPDVRIRAAEAISNLFNI